MANLLVIYDNDDEKMGTYFEASYQDISGRLNQIKSLKLQSLNTKLCLTNPIETYISTFNAQPFVFVAYSHGRENAIDIGENEYIGIKNAYFFAETLFYACCCLTAKQLGEHLRLHGCRVFMGFNNKIKSVGAETDPIFQECENSFISHFLTTNDSVQESLRYMYDKYNESRAFLLEHYNTFTATTLENNLNAFVVSCEDEDLALTKQYFIHKND